MFDFAAAVYLLVAMVAWSYAFVWAVAPLENTEHDALAEMLELALASIGLAMAARVAAVLWRNRTDGAVGALALSLTSFSAWGLLIGG